MSDKSKFEQMLEKLVADDKAAAEEIFHNIVVEKSRSIYEGLLEDDIKAVINKFEPRAQVTDVVTFLEGNSLDVSMYFTVQNDPAPHEINITLQRVR